VKQRLYNTHVKYNQIQPSRHCSETTKHNNIIIKLHKQIIKTDKLVLLINSTLNAEGS